MSASEENEHTLLTFWHCPTEDCDWRDMATGQVLELRICPNCAAKIMPETTSIHEMTAHWNASFSAFNDSLEWLVTVRPDMREQIEEMRQQTLGEIYEMFQDALGQMDEGADDDAS